MSDPRLTHIRDTAEPPPTTAAEAVANGSVTPEQASLTGIDLQAGFVVANIGTAQLTAQEAAAIRKIATKAFKRAMATMISRMSGQAAMPPAEPAKRRGRPPGKKRGRKPGRPKGPSLTASGKRRGRPPKASVVTPQAVAGAAPPAPSAQTSLFTPEGADFQTPPAADTSPATA